MKISVIIPVYNVERYLAQCLESIICQSHKNLEIIIIDDGSPDNSSTIYEKYAANDSRIKIIKQKNAGVSNARNTGLSTATGEYIHIIDSDDYLFSLDYYEKMIDAAIKTDADLVASGWIFERYPRHTLNYSHLSVHTSLIDKLSATNCLFHGYVWRYLFRRKFIEQNNLYFESGVDIFEDMPVVLNSVKLANKIITVPNVMYFYRNNDSGRLSKPKNQKSDDAKYKKMMETLKDFAVKNGCDTLFDYKSTCILKYKTLFNIHLLKIIQYPDYDKYYLFGKIRILKKFKNA